MNCVADQLTWNVLSGGKCQSYRCKGVYRVTQTECQTSEDNIQI